ncbi:Predicted N-acetyltransferase YhbS [Cognatiyoonia koreensis]|uniref:Predicted N-acetyltransferase YhbS n=1 Tax=Cognatiyoonia koreensis TaxID=364200 RepID=A0A1I0MQ28_9RHOB|nr:N-acetyltransferase [Cognatiyoonia koreensis]SEV90630.1 Predicted N-acetyltransferase YhbS [Cognatiyoonia koreensis]
MRTQEIVVTEETLDDWWEVEMLYDLCFAPGRSALSSYRLREDVRPIAALCLVARDHDGVLAGAVRNWPVKVGGKQALLLGPIAVHPTRQGEGIAALLMLDCIGRAAALGWERIMLVGDAPYYGRFGFFRLRDVKMPPPTNPKRVLGLELVDDAWDGVTGSVLRAID